MIESYKGYSRTVLLSVYALQLYSNNQIRGYSRPIIYWGVYDIPVLTIWAHSLSFLISCSRMFAYNNNFLSPSLWYTRLFIVSIIKG